MRTLILDSTTKSLEAKLTGAPATTNPDFVTSWADNTGTTFTEGSTDGALNGSTAVTLAAAPASSTRRIIKSLSIQNKDTAAVTVIIQYNDNSTIRQIAKYTIAVNDTITLEGTYDSTGSFKTVAGSVNLASQVTGILPPANGGTGVANSKNLTVSNSLTLAGTDSTTMTFPSTSQAVAGLTAAQTFTTKLYQISNGPSTTTAEGIIVSLTYGESITVGALVYFKSDGKVYNADADGTGTYPVFGVALATASSGSGNVLMHGTYKDSTRWTGGTVLTVGGVCYLSTTAGAITQTQPTTTDNVIQVVGTAIATDTIYFRPSPDYITHT